MLTDKVTYTDNQLKELTLLHFGGKVATMSIDWLYNPKSMTSEKSVLYIIDGYEEHIQVHKLLRIAIYGT